MKLKTLLITTIGAFVAINADAGEAEPSAKTVIVEEVADTSAILAVGYNTQYIFRGVNFGKNQVSTQIDYQLPNIPVAVGAWYGNPTSGVLPTNPEGRDELRLNVTASHSFGALDMWLGYTSYQYPEGGPTSNEIGTGIGSALGPVDLALSMFYDLDIEGWYIDLTAGHSFVLCDTASLDLSAGISYSVDYGRFPTQGSDFNSVLLMASIPIKLNDTTTLKPYIAGNFALEAIDSFQKDQVFGGISLSVAF